MHCRKNGVLKILSNNKNRGTEEKKGAYFLQWLNTDSFGRTKVHATVVHAHKVPFYVFSIHTFKEMEMALTQWYRFGGKFCDAFPDTECDERATERKKERRRTDGNKENVSRKIVLHIDMYRVVCLLYNVQHKASKSGEEMKKKKNKEENTTQFCNRTRMISRPWKKLKLENFGASFDCFGMI